MSSKRGKPNFVWATEDTFKDIQECAEREENKKRCAELEEKLNHSSKNATK
jgi:PHD/YefM family antitoxin component YafN of YafNO toxin-antitoxin module